MLSPVFCLMGPTASGKTDLAAICCEQLPLEIISVDSAMVYRSMDIGTAKPSLNFLAKTPHHLIDIRNPDENYSVAEFCKDGLNLAEQILARGRIPCFVGGTMMYYRALQQGLSALPAADEALRAEIEAEASQFGWPHLHARLSQFDPATAAKIKANDASRIQRALEVYYLQGESISQLREKKQFSQPYRFINLMLMPEERAWLHQRIAVRFGQMLEQGFIEEVQSLLEKWPLAVSGPAMRSVGYRQALPYLDGEDSYQSFCDKTLAATRQLAKRQLTWLRHWPEGQYFIAEDRNLSQKIVESMAKILDNA